MRFKEGIQHLIQGKANKFILVGLEPYLKDYFIRYAKRHFQVDPLYFYPDDEREALESLCSMSFFDKSLIILRNLDKANHKKYEKAIEKTENNLIISLSEDADITKSISNIVSMVTRVDCSKMREYGEDYPSWILSVAKEFDLFMADGAEDTLFSLVGPNMFLIYHEIKKLSFLKTDNKTVLPQDVKNAISNLSISSSYDILNCLITKNVSGALKCFESYSKTTDNFIGIISFIATYMEKMYKALVLRDKKIEPDDIAGIIGINKYLLKTKYLPRALSIGKTKLLEYYNNLCLLDVSVRKFKGNKKILIENFIYSFI